MSRLGTSCLAVTEDAHQSSKVFGVIGEQEILRQELSLGRSILHTRLKDLIGHTKNHFEVTDSAEFADECLARLVEADADYTLVRDPRGDFVGILDTCDLLISVRRKYDLEIDQLRTAAVDRRFGLM